MISVAISQNKSALTALTALILMLMHVKIKIKCFVDILPIIYN